MNRQSLPLVHELFPARWSPRAFRPEPLDPAQVESLFEAARWSPSGFNDQPWFFLFATGTAERAAAVQALAPFNQGWAKDAPLLAFLFRRTAYRHNGQPNGGSAFDAGAAWMALALQAQHLGLSAHAMGGFDPAAALALAGLSGDTHQALCAIAVGRRGDAATLPADVQAREHPSDRLPLDEIRRELRLEGSPA